MSEKDCWDDGYLTALCLEPNDPPSDCSFVEEWHKGYEAGISAVNMKSQLRILGDVHGKYDKYLPLTKKANYSLQVGDMGFDYRYLTRTLDSDCHKIIGGNHDSYNRTNCSCQGDKPEPFFPEDACNACEGRGYVYDQSKHFLGDYGVWEVPDFGPIFYTRGAWSIDMDCRLPGISWWEDEELPYRQCTKALAAYKEIKPDFVVTHTAPQQIIPSIPFQRIFGNKIHGTRTETLLGEMWDCHQPKMWIFGHWHKDWCQKIIHPKTYNSTLFVCLDELSYMDFPANFKFEDFKPVIQK